MIDTSGKWWKGDSPGDIGEYLRRLSADSYGVNDFRLSTCKCGCVEFQVEADGEEGAARRTCKNCGLQTFICDSEEYWAEAEPAKIRCKCKAKCINFNVGVGFALTQDKQAVRWIFIGIRCTACGILGSPAEWKIDYEPSLQLLRQS